MLADLLPPEHGWKPTLRIGDFEVLPHARAAHRTTQAEVTVCRPASSTNRQRAYASRICSIERQPISSSRGDATTYARHLARDTATFNRLREKRNSRLR